MNTPQENTQITPSDEFIKSILAGRVNEKIEELEAELLTLEQVEMPVEHRFINGMYVREITIPKGTILTGAVHKFDYVDIMLGGDIAVATPDGVKRFKGVNIMDGKAGRKRAGYAYEDTRWISVHKTDASNPDNIVDILTVRTMAEFEGLPISDKQLATENKGDQL
ncbi:hypothetical protein SAMN02745753_03740 [Marinomonas polaris DSM 16579]|uniref:Uncharacterized protein n=1 Tax=Marinomonas polaris DSM 16579 TaxID=1122206 RepID=A0A1M5J2Z6_9GAMM|nr:hypothetical protein [Marinomonas polaris]SHG34393.1 hypothetical protein SAMN02745753_03740 [Marinomonas polaris DSM 16579]|tara:strand:+ start:182 stop:679 length:498 start_codon:yes stop_codon:yes gene_type:complete